MQQLKDLLQDTLTKKQIDLLPASFDIVGDILIFADFPQELQKKEKRIGESILKLLKHIKVVAKKTKKYSGKYRTPKLKIIAGEKRKETVYKENDVRLKLHVEKVYFSPRLSNERKRIAGLVQPGESVLVMFSGCAPYPCVIAKNSKPKEVVCIEINPAAHKYAEENIKLNKLNNVTLYLGDVKKIIPKLHQKFDRILMPLPKGAEAYLDIALKASKKGTVLHFYDFLNEIEFEKAHEKISVACLKANKHFLILNTVKCGQFSPGVFRVCVDFMIK
jgi:tRNA (guanine37-N1)-methyltransferase